VSKSAYSAADAPKTRRKRQPRLQTGNVLLGLKVPYSALDKAAWLSVSINWWVLTASPPRSMIIVHFSMK